MGIYRKVCSKDTYMTK